MQTTTVFILGAGASEPFGFPLGSQLYKDVVLDYSRNTSSRSHLFNCTSFTESQLTEFIKDLQQSGLSSVDLFLENRHRDFLDIGKACMAITLIQKEVSTKLWDGDTNWMKYLWQRLQPFERLADNPISFITFNYDRSLEHFLVTSLKNTLGISIEESAKIVSKIPIIHLHGGLGYLPWQKSDEGRDYGPYVDRNVVELCLQHIHVIHEEPDETRVQEFLEARSLMAGATNVYFLGFGFGERNVERLKIRDLPIKSHGTAMGLRTKEIDETVDACGGKVQLYNELDCIEFLRNRAVLK